MKGTEYIRIPDFLSGEELPPGYFDSPNPYEDPPLTKYNLRAMVNYALQNGRDVTDLTKEEVKPFMIPRIKKVEALDNLVLHVTFDGGEEVLYDVKEDVKDIPSFSLLETEEGLFKNFTLDSSRTCVSWTDMIDLPSDTILEYGKRVTAN